MPDQTVDQRWIAAATRIRALRPELDLLDDQLGLLPRDELLTIGQRAAEIRCALDDLEVEVEQRAAVL
jgi:hypothetical protein